MIEQVGKQSVWLGFFCLMAISPCTLAEEQAQPENNPEPAAKVEAPQSLMLHEAGQLPGYVALDVGGQKIDAVLTTERLGKSYGGVLLLPDKDEGFNDTGVIQTLRKALPDYGWSVMSVALTYPDQPHIFLSEGQKIDVDIKPDTQSEAEKQPDKTEENTEKAASDAKPEPESTTEKKDKPVNNQNRIQAAISYFNQQAIPRLILVGHGYGATEAINMLKADKQAAVALIGIGGDIDEHQFTELADGTVIMEVLPAGLGTESIRARKAEMKRLNKEYVQRILQAQDKNFEGAQQALVSTVSGWLYKQFIHEAEQ